MDPIAVDIRVLGPLDVLRGGERVGPAGAKRRGLLALLAVEANHVLPMSVLVDRLWGEHPPATAANVVQTYVSTWRKVLEPDRHRGGLPRPPRLGLDGVEDVFAFDPGYSPDWTSEHVTVTRDELLDSAGRMVPLKVWDGGDWVAVTPDWLP